MNQNNNKTVLVTGSSRGIGRAIALYLAKENYNIIVHYNQNKNKALEVLEEIKPNNNQARILQFDTNNRKQCQEIITKDIEEYGVYYGIVCNAGIAKDEPFPLLSGDDWDSVIGTNLNGFYNVLHPIIMPMIQARNGGRIITMSSVSGLVGNRGQVNYSAAKAGIIGATKALALELAKRKITVNCIAPGIIESEMTENLPKDEILKMIPLRRLGQPEEVASLVNYLLSKDAGYITRQVFSVNGGLI